MQDEKQNEGKQLGTDESQNFQTRTEDMQKRDADGIKNGKVYLTTWFTVEHGEEVHGEGTKVLLIFSLELSTE